MSTKSAPPHLGLLSLSLSHFSPHSVSPSLPNIYMCPNFFVSTGIHRYTKNGGEQRTCLDTVWTGSKLEVCDWRCSDLSKEKYAKVLQNTSKYARFLAPHYVVYDCFNNQLPISHNSPTLHRQPLVQKCSMYHTRSC